MAGPGSPGRAHGPWSTSVQGKEEAVIVSREEQNVANAALEVIRARDAYRELARSGKITQADVQRVSDAREALEARISIRDAKKKNK